MSNQPLTSNSTHCQPLATQIEALAKPPRFMHGTPPSCEQLARIKRILVCQLRQIGDVLLATPSVSLLAKAFPQAEIHFFTEKKCTPMLEHNPHIHTVWALNKKELPTLWQELRFYHSVANNQFDLVVDFQQLPRTRWVVGMSQAPLRLAFPPAWYLRPLYTHWTLPAHAYAGTFKAGILTPLGIHWQGERPELYLSEAETAEAQSLLAQWGINPEITPFVTLDVTHRRLTRRWPNEKYAQLINILSDKFPHLRFLLSYGPGEQEEVQALQHLCSQPQRVIIPDTMITLRQLAACMQLASAHIGNCSAPRHIAVAVDVPTITILGATSGGWTFPSERHVHIALELPCQPCNKNNCDKNFACLYQLEAQKVADIAMQHLIRFGKNITPKTE